MLVVVAATVLQSSSPVPAQANKNGHVWHYALMIELRLSDAKKTTWAWAKPIPDDTRDIDALNIVGQDGWELVWVKTEGKAGYAVVTEFYFKKQD